MKWLCNFVSVLLVLVVCVLSAPSAKAGTGSITQCNQTITSAGEYDLANDLTCGPGINGIVIQASDVTLHLNHHTIKPSTAGTCNKSTGVLVRPQAGAQMLSHVRVLGDGTISNFYIGFFAENSNDSFVKFTTVTAKCPFFTFGIAILGPANHWKLQGNVVREPSSLLFDESSQGITLQKRMPHI